MSTDILPKAKNAAHTAPIVVDGISYIPSSALLTGIDKVNFKGSRAFGVLDPSGEAPRLYSPGSELGYFFNDTRYLCVWETHFNGKAAIPLAKELRSGGSRLVFSMTNSDTEARDGTRVPRDTFLIRRILIWQGDVLFETIEVRNYCNVDRELRVDSWVGGRFDDIFEVRGYLRENRGRMLSPELSGDANRRIARLQYLGLDGRIRSAWIQRFFDAQPIHADLGLIWQSCTVVVPARGHVFLRTVLSFDEPVNDEVAELVARDPDRELRSAFDGVKIQCDNELIKRAIHNAQTDILMLLTEEAPGEPYPYAGIPWYSAPFGRDGVITAYQLLPWYPDVARGVLNRVFEWLGSRFDAFTDEQPGKVFHELRRGEMALLKEVPFIPYYGSVDSTPLALILLQDYVRWTGDLESLRRWWPQALRALEWVEKWGDSDRDGLLEYSRQSPRGLVNQGWKDSHDSIMHADGQLAEAPIRLCEVQAYAFRARMGMSRLAMRMNDSELSSRIRHSALELRSLFTERFWDAEREFIYLALDGAMNPCKVLSSNMGHCLWGKIVTPEQAAAVAKHLVSDSLYSGYGVRTLGETEAAYNPLSYHNGSVWPHDNSILMEGLRFYGRTHELGVLVSGMLGVLESSEDFRLPELFCGFRRRGNVPPVPYEVACKPQAWAAGSVFLMIKSMLGMNRDSDQRSIVFNSPMLPGTIQALEIHGLKGIDWELDLRFRRSKVGTQVDVLRKSGVVRVLTVK